MTDVFHLPEITLQGWVCSVCGDQLPADVSSLGDEVVDIGYAGVHFLPRFAHDARVIGCDNKLARRTSTVITCYICDGVGCESCTQGVLGSDGSKPEIEQAELQPGQIVESFPAKPEIDKQMSAMSFNTFLGLREATRPSDA